MLALTDTVEDFKLNQAHNKLVIFFASDFLIFMCCRPSCGCWDWRALSRHHSESCWDLFHHYLKNNFIRDSTTKNSPQFPTIISLRRFEKNLSHDAILWLHVDDKIWIPVESWVAKSNTKWRKTGIGLYPLHYRR